MSITLKMGDEIGPKRGFVASSFDLLHAGHCIMLEDAKSKCDYLIAALQTDPTIDRPEKNKPIQSLDERYIVLNSNKNVDEIILYKTEEELYEIIQLLEPDVRILGSDWENKNFTGKGLIKEVYFHDRSHGYSTSELRNRIYKAEAKRYG
tara:strand:+ start:128 stop:577 length:450 start_codon:yes stop_codon:yes gene_type:complete